MPTEQPVTADDLFRARPTSMYQTGVIARGATNGEAMRVGVDPQHRLTTAEIQAVGAAVEQRLDQLLREGEEGGPNAIANMIARDLVQAAENAKKERSSKAA
jgi:hypothetical protein